VLVLGAAVAAAAVLGSAAAGRPVRAGGVFRVAGAPDAIDPAITLDASDALAATCTRLMRNPDRPPPEGSRTFPDGAAGYPAVSDDGRTYTFRIRTGIRFASGEPVTARNFAHAIERVLAPATNSPWAQYMQDIVGANAVLKGKATTPSGVTARGDTLVVRLTHAAPDFPARTTTTSFCAVPANLPVSAEGATVLPGSGPFTVHEFVPSQKLVLVPNPLYRGTRPRHVDEIVFAPTGDPVAAVEHGAADYAEADPEALAAVPARYRSQLHAAGGASIRFVVLNSARPLFRANPKLRRAVNFAVDRRALVAVRGGSITGRLTDQYLPASMPGFRDARIYPLAHPDLRRARTLARGHTRSGTAALWVKDTPTDIAQAHIIQRDLRPLGLRVTVTVLPGPALFQRLFTPGSAYDLTLLGYGPDYFDPYAMLDVLFDGRLLGTPYSFNLGHFDSPAEDARFAAASKLRPDARYRAYGALDVALARDQAPAIAYEDESILNLVSKRAGCLVFNPGLDLAAVCIK